MKKKREGAELSLAFLDVICCGFGAIILLLMITKVDPPEVLDTPVEDQIAQVLQTQEAIKEILGIIDELQRTEIESEKDLALQIEELAKLQEELIELTSRYEAAIQITEKQRLEIEDVARAQQKLSDDMISLLGTNYVRQDNTIGGIPVDSEYIIFVIDTSGSMKTIWGFVQQKFTEVLNVYPVVKGIQVMNDNGRHMQPSTRGTWLPDTPNNRNRIVTRLTNWNVSSNSSPVEGIEEAISTYYDKTPNGEGIGIYVFGDDFQPDSSVEEVVDRIDRVNIADDEGNRRVRIHAVGFPVYYTAGTPTWSVFRFSNLMRELTVRNNGTFVALPYVR